MPRLQNCSCCSWDSKLHLVFHETQSTDGSCFTGDGYISNHRVLLFVWVVLFKKLIAAVLIGTYIRRVLVIDGYFYLYGLR